MFQLQLATVAGASFSSKQQALAARCRRAQLLPERGSTAAHSSNLPQHYWYQYSTATTGTSTTAAAVLQYFVPVPQY
jgi:hypothetical protein